MEINTHELKSFFDTGYFNPTDNFGQSNIAELNLGKSETLILCFSETTTLVEEEKILLQNILKAVGIDINEVNLLLNPNISVRDILLEDKIKTCLLFGLNSKEISFHAIPCFYQPISFKGIAFLFSDSLKELNADTNKKNYLWRALQQIFK